MIRRGLRIDDDDDVVSPIKQQRNSLDANRKRDAFEKDMDNLLFGGGPVRRRQQKKQQPKTQLKSEISPSKVVMVTPQKSNPSTVKKVDSMTEYKSLQMDKKVLNEKPAEKSAQLGQSKTQITPKKNEQNEPLKNSRGSRHQSSVIIAKEDAQKKYLQDRQKSTTFIQIQGSRPNYIRKLKAVSGDFNFDEENRIKHKNIDVVRSIICSKSYMKKFHQIDFKDNQFPPVHASLGFQLQNFDVKWKKYESFVNHATFGKYIDPNDIKKGQFSSFKFLSTLSVLAQRQQNIKRLVENQKFNSENGLYFVRLFINSVWRYYAVDSYVPFLQGQLAGATSYIDSESDMWVALIEKAYAKAFEGYGVFDKPQPREYYLRDLTGAPIKSYKSENPQVLQIVKSAIEKKKVVMALPKLSISNLGINPNCNLTVLNLNKKGGLTLRYSWPMIEDSGQFMISKQGIVEFSDTQMLQYISHVAIAHINRDYFTTTIQTRHEKGFYVAYKLLIKQKTHGYFTQSQFDERLFPKDLYSYQPARLFLHKKTEDNKFEYIKGGFSHRERNLDVQVQLTPGEYHLFAFVNWNRQVYDFNLTFYGSRSVDFIKIPTVQNHNFISFGLQQYNLQNGKRSALGHVHQFINYYEDTNLVLITVVNTSSKEYKYTNDIQKINFESLELINLINNQHDCLENLSTKELQAFKVSVGQNRKWEISLGPQETFTWVISTTQNYDPNNFRNWGFR